MMRIKWLNALVCVALMASLSSSTHFNVKVPYSGEIFDAEDTTFDFTLSDAGGLLEEGAEIVVWINGAVATRTRNVVNKLKIPAMRSGLHMMNLQLLGPDGADSGVGFGTEFEVTFFPFLPSFLSPTFTRQGIMPVLPLVRSLSQLSVHQPSQVTNFARPEEIAPIPDRARGIRSDSLPIESSRDFGTKSGAVQEMLHQHQHPGQVRKLRDAGREGVRKKGIEREREGARRNGERGRGSGRANGGGKRRDMKMKSEMDETVNHRCDDGIRGKGRAGEKRAREGGDTRQPANRFLTCPPCIAGNVHGSSLPNLGAMGNCRVWSSAPGVARRAQPWSPAWSRRRRLARCPPHATRLYSGGPTWTCIPN